MRLTKLIKKPGTSTIKQREKRVGYLFVAPATIYFFITFGCTVIYTIYLTVHEFSLIGESHFVGLSKYTDVLMDSKFWLSLKNTFYFTIINVPVLLVLALGIAFLFSSATDFKYKRFYKAIYFLPVITSQVAVAFVWKWLYHPDIGLFNSILTSIGLHRQLWLSSTTQVIPSLAVMEIWARTGFDMIILIAGLEAIPTELYEAAKIDGATKWKSFLHVTLPLLNSQILLVSIVEVITSLRMFALPYVATGGGPGNASRFIVLHIFDMAFKWMRLGEASVAALFLFIMIVVISILQWKYLRNPVEY